MRKKSEINTEFNWSIDTSFILDEERIKSIAKVLQNHAKEQLSISISCQDGATRKYENPETLIEYENASKRRIRSLQMYSGMSWKPTASIKFTRKAIGISYPFIDVHVIGTEKTASHTNRELKELAEGGRPWYSWISKPNTFFLWLPFYLITAVFSSQPGVVDISHMVLRIIVILTLSIGLAAGVVFIIRLIFPRAVFLIGQEKTRHKTMERARWLTITTLLTATVGAIFTWLL